ncbi:MAG: hypothetical protein NZM25_09655 [Leptospiraceae bacterium]|nr:hypothetical protein [Leptospiraceae bacterium]MDW8306423.1 hypothetical protein [Leptospiraceae bacterium]
MQKYLEKVDSFIDFIISKIPPHIRDILKKAGLAILAIVFLLALTYGIRMGVRDAIPAGIQLSGSTKDLFYLQELREANEKKQRLFEDVEVDPMSFPSRQTNFATMGKDTSDRLLGEKEEFLRDPDFLRPKSKGPVFVEEDIFTPRRFAQEQHEIREETSELLAPNKKSSLGHKSALSSQDRKMDFLE